MPKALKLAVRWATPGRWRDVEALFGERGACGGCWCMFWRVPRSAWVAGKGAGNKRAFKKIVASGERPGVIGYLGKTPVAWCALAPREVYGGLDRSRVLAPVDDAPVWSVSCLFVAKSHRRLGLSRRIIAAAAALAATRGARILEGYPIEPTMARTPDAFVWTGLPSAFAKAGFTEVARRSKTRPIMRYEIRRGASST